MHSNPYKERVNIIQDLLINLSGADLHMVNCMFYIGNYNLKQTRFLR